MHAEQFREPTPLRVRQLLSGKLGKRVYMRQGPCCLCDTRGSRWIPCPL